MWAIRWTEWSESHVARHGVTRAEVSQVMQHRPLYAPGREQEVEGEFRPSTMIFGVTDTGRHLFVVVSPDLGGETAFVVTARPMTAKEKRMFQQYWEEQE